MMMYVLCCVPSVGVLRGTEELRDVVSYINVMGSIRRRLFVHEANKLYRFTNRLPDYSTLFCLNILPLLLAVLDNSRVAERSNRNYYRDSNKVVCHKIE